MRLRIDSGCKEVCVLPGAKYISCSLEEGSASFGECIKFGTSSSAPSKRCGHQAVVHAGNMFIFGGTDQLGQCASILFCYNFGVYHIPYSVMLTWHPEKNQWSQVRVKKGDPPSPRNQHSAVLWENSIFIFGGRTATGWRREPSDNSLYCFNLGIISLPGALLLDLTTLSSQTDMEESECERDATNRSMGPQRGGLWIFHVYLWRH